MLLDIHKSTFFLGVHTDMNEKENESHENETEINRKRVVSRVSDRVHPGGTDGLNFIEDMSEKKCNKEYYVKIVDFNRTSK